MPKPHISQRPTNIMAGAGVCAFHCQGQTRSRVPSHAQRSFCGMIHARALTRGRQVRTRCGARPSVRPSSLRPSPVAGLRGSPVWLFVSVGDSRVLPSEVRRADTRACGPFRSGHGIPKPPVLCNAVRAHEDRARRAARMRAPLRVRRRHGHGTGGQYWRWDVYRACSRASRGGNRFAWDRTRRRCHRRQPVPGRRGTLEFECLRGQGRRGGPSWGEPGHTSCRDGTIRHLNTEGSTGWRALQQPGRPTLPDARALRTVREQYALRESAHGTAPVSGVLATLVA
eukprot:350227-Chlamydomonas_euryale.AAC.1